jgi:hypothetical protein
MTEMITATNDIRYPRAAPRDNNWNVLPRSEWQSRIKEELRSLLCDGGWMMRRATTTFFRSDMAQVYLDNWTLHFQIAIGGSEFKDKRYEGLEGKALVTFDVEGGRPNMDRADLNKLRNEIHAALISNEVYEKLGVENHPIGEHLVWDTIDARETAAGAKRLIEYMEVIYDIACPVLDRLENAD